MRYPGWANGEAASEQEYHHYDDLLDATKEALGGHAPDGMTGDRGLSVYSVFRRNTIESIASVIPWRQKGGITSREQLRCDLYDEYGVPRCQFCGSEGDQLFAGSFRIVKGKPRIYYRCKTPHVPECDKEQSIASEENWSMLLPLPRTHPRYYDLHQTHQPFERIHAIWRARYGVYGDNDTSRLRRWSQSVPAQRVRAEAARFIEWFRILLRQGWIGSHKQINDQAPFTRNGCGESGWRRTMAARRKKLLNYPYGEAAKRLNLVRAGPAPPPLPRRGKGPPLEPLPPISRRCPSRARAPPDRENLPRAASAFEPAREGRQAPSASAAGPFSCCFEAFLRAQGWQRPILETSPEMPECPRPESNQRTRFRKPTTTVYRVRLRVTQCLRAGLSVHLVGCHDALCPWVDSRRIPAPSARIRRHDPAARPGRSLVPAEGLETRHRWYNEHSFLEGGVPRGLRLAFHALAAVGVGVLVAGVVAAGAASVSGSINASDPAHSPALDAQPPASACAGAKSTPGTLTGSYHYDSYPFTNTTAAAACYTVSLTTPAASDSAFVAAYLGSFDPANPQTNYLGDPGGCTNAAGQFGASSTFAFNVPAGQSFVVVVEECDPDTFVSSYTLDVTGGQPTAVTFRSAVASRTEHGVLVRWRTGTDARTVGFNVYRQHGARRQQLNPALIRARGRMPGRAYSFLDRHAPRERSLRYLLQSVGLDGSSSWEQVIARSPVKGTG